MILTAYVAQLAKGLDTRVVRHRTPRMDHYLIFIKWVLKYYLEVIVYHCV